METDPKTALRSRRKAATWVRARRCPLWLSRPRLLRRGCCCRHSCCDSDMDCTTAGESSSVRLRAVFLVRGRVSGSVATTNKAAFSAAVQEAFVTPRVFTRLWRTLAGPKAAPRGSLRLSPSELSSFARNPDEAQPHLHTSPAEDEVRVTPLSPISDVCGVERKKERKKRKKVLADSCASSLAGQRRCRWFL